MYKLAKNVKCDKLVLVRVLKSYNEENKECKVVGSNTMVIVNNKDLLNITVANISKVARNEMIENEVSFEDINNNGLCETLHETTKIIYLVADDIINLTKKEHDYIKYESCIDINQIKAFILMDLVEYKLYGVNRRIKDIKSHYIEY